MPGREFWSLWVRALVCIVLACLFVLAHRPAHAETMRASFYGAESGPRAADGSRFNPMGFTAAHRTMAFGTRLQVCLRGCTVVTVTDRGPFVAGRQLDLSRGAARAIGLESAGVANIEVTVVGQGRAPGRRVSHHHRRSRR